MVELFDFGEGEVPAHRHKNQDGTVGGWVAETATVAETVCLGKNARVYGNARLSGNVCVFGKARIYGRAKLSGNAWIHGKAQVLGNTRIYKDEDISGRAKISDTRGILSGDDGIYDWNAWRDDKGDIWVRYGCELHKLQDWPRLYGELAIRHGYPVDSPGPKAACSYVRELWK